MKRATTFSVLSILACCTGPLFAVDAPEYLRGFVWDWRVDFGEPHAVSDLPPNPNNDSGSRGRAGNAGLSSGPQASSVWQYGNAAYSALLDGTFTPSDFVVFTQAGSRVVLGHDEYFWSDSLTITGNWDQVVFGPSNPVHPGHYVHPDSHSGQEAAILRWTYPGQSSTTLRIRGTVEDCSPGGHDGVDFYLLRNSSLDTLASVVIPDGGSYTADATTLVEPGDELFLGIGYLADAGSDSTYVDLTFEVIPEPAPLALLALGGLGLVRRRRRA